MPENNVGSLVIDFEADMNDFKMAISEVKGLMKDVSNETRKSTADFAILAGVTGGAVSFGLNAMKDGIGGIIGGLNKYLATNPEFVQAQSDLNMTFMDLAQDVGPGVSNVLQGFNSLLTEMEEAGFFDTINDALMNFGDSLKNITDEDLEGFNEILSAAVDLLGSLTDETTMNGFKEAFSDISIILEAVAGFITTIKDGWGWVKDNVYMFSDTEDKFSEESLTNNFNTNFNKGLSEGDYGISGAIYQGFMNIMDYLKLLNS